MVLNVVALGMKNLLFLDKNRLFRIGIFTQKNASIVVVICRDISSETVLNVLNEPQLYFEIDEICTYLGPREVP